MTMSIFSGILRDITPPKSIRLSVSDRLILMLPLFLFFNHNPHISFGRGVYETNYEINLLLLYLVIVVIYHIPLLIKNIPILIKRSDVLLILLFGIYNTISILWTPEPLRGMLTSVMIWLLIAVFLIFITNSKLKQLSKPILYIYIYTAAAMSLFALYQMFFGSFIETKDLTLLCPGCQFTQFGFPRPNAFSVEPQFFGSLLVLPLIFLFYKTFSDKLPKRHFIVFLLIVVVLFLTLSRGAIYSFIAAIIVISLFNYKFIRSLWKPLVVCFTGMIVTLIFQGVSATINPTISDTFGGSIIKSLDQLTLGKLDLENPDQKTAPSPMREPTINQTQPSVFQGYIEASTSERISNTCKSLTIWSNSLDRQLFGVGVGGTGYYFYHPTKEVSSWCKISL